MTDYCSSETPKIWGTTTVEKGIEEGKQERKKSLTVWIEAGDTDSP